MNYVILFLSLVGLIPTAKSSPTCEQFFHYEIKGIDWPYAHPMRDFAHQCKSSVKVSDDFTCVGKISGSRLKLHLSFKDGALKVYEVFGHPGGGSFHHLVDEVMEKTTTPEGVLTFKTSLGDSALVITKNVVNNTRIGSYSSEHLSLQELKVHCYGKIL